MAEQNQTALRRAPSASPKIERAGLRLQPEPDLGIAKLQIFGAKADARFHEVAGLARPGAQTQCVSGSLSVAWLAPAEWLITGSETDIVDRVSHIEQRGGDEVFAIDLTHARTSFLLSGSESRTALAAHCPLDLWAEFFPVGAVARSLLGEAGLFLARLSDTTDGPRFRLIVDQTMAAYVGRLFAGA